LFSLNNPNIFKTQSLEENIDDYLKEEINEEDELMTFVTIDDAPVIKRKKHKKRSNNYKRKRRNNRLSNNKYSNRKKLSKNKKNNDINDETRFNSEEYHKKQHDL